MRSDLQASSRGTWLFIYLFHFIYLYRIVEKNIVLIKLRSCWVGWCYALENDNNYVQGKFAVSTSGSIDRSTILLLLVVHAIGHREGSVSYVEESSCLEQGMIGDDKDLSGKVCVKWKDNEFERQVGSESLIPRGGAIHAQATVTRRRELSSTTEKSTDTPGSVDSLLRHVEITGDFDFLKITTTETTFLPVKTTPESQHARTSNERNKVAPQVKCSWKRNKPKVMSTQRIPTSCIVAVEIA